MLWQAYIHPVDSYLIDYIYSFIEQQIHQPTKYQNFPNNSKTFRFFHFSLIICSCCRLISLVSHVRRCCSIAMQCDQCCLSRLHFNESYRNQPKRRWHQMANLLGFVCALFGIWVLYWHIDLNYSILLLAQGRFTIQSASCFMR